MALAARRGGRMSGSVWPGFVDMMTALLLIVMFVLSIFMIIQFSLRERITGQDKALHQLSDQLSASEDRVSRLSTQLAQLSNALGLEQERATGLPLGTIAPGESRRKRAVRGMDRQLVRIRPTLFGYQFILRLTPHAEEAVVVQVD